MAEFISKCPHCKSDLQLNDEWQGMSVQCPLCARYFSVITNSSINALSKPKTKKISKTLFLIICSEAIIAILLVLYIIKEELDSRKSRYEGNQYNYYQKLEKGLMDDGWIITPHFIENSY